AYVLKRLPLAKTADAYEQLLPWNITPQDLITPIPLPDKAPVYGSLTRFRIFFAPPCKLSSKFQLFNRHRQAVDLIGLSSISS
ncbi:MAG: transposase domain-containing protein, partial [Burkholderiaceae bacterium]|nr:transposase domain-containing protein [Burkholderiaceae bacterium]